jgi:hypothetical protein
VTATTHWWHQQQIRRDRNDTVEAYRWHQQQIRRGTTPTRSGNRRGIVLKRAAAKLSKKIDPRRGRTTKLNKRTDIKRGAQPTQQEN